MARCASRTTASAICEARMTVKPDELFQIGSISKSFVGLCLMQLRDEGKLDVQRPIVEYLPWFRIESAFAPITVHHLLTHSSVCRARWDPSSAIRRSGIVRRTRRANISTTTTWRGRPWAIWPRRLDGRELPAHHPCPRARAARDDGERAGDHPRHARPSGEELFGIPERSPPAPQGAPVRSAGNRHHQRRRVRREHGARHGQLHPHDRQPRRRAAWPPHFREELRAVHGIAHRGWRRARARATATGCSSTSSMATRRFVIRAAWSLSCPR